MKEFKSLSDKRKNLRKRVKKLFNSEILDIVEKQDKGFIKRLKSFVPMWSNMQDEQVYEQINELAGKDLI